MTEPVSAAANSVVQQLVQQLTAPLKEAATAFTTTVAESLAKQVEETTKAFNQAHPAVTTVTGDIIGWTSAVATSAGSLAVMSGNVKDMIINTRGMRQEISKVLDAFPALDGIRLRLMLAGDAIRNLNMETVKNTVTQARAAVATRLHAVAQAVTTAATKAWAIAQRVLNVVLSLNPIGLIVTGIMLLIGAIVLAYQRSTTFRNIVNAAFSAVRNVAMSVFNAIRNAVAVIWPYIVRIIQVAVTAVRVYITTYFTVIRVIVTTVWTAIRTATTTVWQAILAFVTTSVNTVRAVVTTVFNAVRGVVQAVWNGIRTAISKAVSTVVNVVHGVQQVHTIVRDAFNRARTAVGDAIHGVVDFARRLPGQVTGALGNIGHTLYQSGKDLIQGFINGLRDMSGRVVSAIKDFVLDKVPGPIKSFLGISSPSRLMAGIGENIGEGLVVGIDNSRDMVGQAMQRLVPAPKAAVIRPAIAGVTQGALAATVPGAGAVAPRSASTAGAAVTVNVHPRAGQSEYEIGRIVARELAWAVKS